MIDATALGLRDVAGPDLYRRNAFRITGLPTDADRRTIRQRQQQVVAALRVGADVGVPRAVEPDEVHAAFDRLLGDPRRRIVDEVLWLWDTQNATCSCPRSLHRDHDAAVRAHSEVLDREVAGTAPAASEVGQLDELWADAARHWRQALRRAAFWDHVRHRIAELDDRQLDDSAVDIMREDIAATLVKPLVDLALAAADPARLADHAGRWPTPPGVVDDQFADAAAPIFDELNTTMEDVRELLEANRPHDAAETVYNHAKPTLERLEGLLPHDQHQRTAAMRDTVAIALNNCATTLLDQSGLSADGDIRGWLDAADELATEDQTRRTIDQNRTSLVQEVQAFDQLRRQIRELVALGRVAEAKMLLRRLRRQVGDGYEAREVERLLAEIGARPHATPVRSRGRRLLGLRRYEWLLLICLAIFLIWHYWPFGMGGPTATLWSEEAADNAPPGSCILTRDGWNVKERVSIVDCDESHWGEVLGYPALADVQSQYPGRNQVRALGRFECRRLLAQRGLPIDKYTTSSIVPNRDYWNQRVGEFENYTTCVVHRPDNKPLDQQLVNVDRPLRKKVSVEMDLYNESIWANAPVGTCVETKQSVEASVHAVPIVGCKRPHWAEIIGYPTLYGPNEPWPGDDAVYQAAKQACQDLAAPVLPTFTVRVIWPGKDTWNDQNKPIYAACLVHLPDDRPITGALRP